MANTEKSNIFQDIMQGKIGRRDLLTRALMVGMTAGSLEALLAACGGNQGGSGGSGSTTVKYANWASAESATKTQIDQALQGFETQFKAKVENIAIPFDNMLTQLQTMTTGGNPPDVMELSGNWPYALGGGGALQSLNSYTGSWRNDAFTNTFEVGSYKGQVYAVPFSISPHGFWYNKTILQKYGLSPDKPPTSIDELNSVMEELRAKLPANAHPIGIDISKTEYALVGFWPWIWTFGGDPMHEDNQGNVTINWADDGTVKAFQWLQDAVKKNWTPPDQAIKAERQLMSTDQMVFKLDGPYLTGILQSDNPSVYKSVADVNTHWGVTTTPVGPGQSAPVTCADIHNLGMSANSNNKDLAWKLIDYLTSNKQVLTNYLVTEGVFPHKSQVTSGGPYANLFSDDISQAFINKVFPTMRPPAYHPKYSQAATYVVTALQDIAGGANVPKRLAQLNTDVKTVFGQ